MPYVQRDEEGKITGVYANAQPGYAEEHLPEDNEDVNAYEASVRALFGSVEAQ